MVLNVTSHKRIEKKCCVFNIDFNVLSTAVSC